MLLPGTSRSILMPLGLDLLLWLGPRLSLDQIAQPLLAQASSLAPSSGLQPADVTAALEMYTQFFKSFNLLVALRTFPIGVFSLMSGRMPTQSPLGTPLTFQLDSPLHVLGLIFALTLTGWMFGALYFHWVASLVGARPLSETPAAAAHALIQTLLYSRDLCRSGLDVGVARCCLSSISCSRSTRCWARAYCFSWALSLSG